MRLFLLLPHFFGLRPGVLFRPPHLSKPSPITGAFVYVAESGPSCKIGVTQAPRARLASLRTGSPRPIDMPYIVATRGDGFDIEARAHAILEAYRQEGEWFGVPLWAAIAAVNAAASDCDKTTVALSLDQAEMALAIAREREARPSPLRRAVHAMAITGASILTALVTWFVVMVLKA